MGTILSVDSTTTGKTSAFWKHTLRLQFMRKVQEHQPCMQSMVNEATVELCSCRSSTVIVSVCLPVCSSALSCLLAAAIETRG